jgi:hypothetical protein
MPLSPRAQRALEVFEIYLVGILFPLVAIPLILFFVLSLLQVI